MRALGYRTVDALVDWLSDDSLPALRRAEPAEYFGEIAALDWGAGFVRSRAATVIAREHVRVRVLAPSELKQLLAAFPRLEDELRRTAHQRLRRAP